MVACSVRRFCFFFCLLKVIFSNVFLNERFCIDIVNGVRLIVKAAVCGEILKYRYLVNKINGIALCGSKAIKQIFVSLVE